MTYSMQYNANITYFQQQPFDVGDLQWRIYNGAFGHGSSGPIGAMGAVAPLPLRK